ncbi:hypothetical protein PoB_000712400 [Plakobranchus ocellatus]|uniref:Uncharacterized protein n=1 Tax=Plakobranchus ocellatus TaxID=259542 RepID=A0AAV3YEX5_9GAST|nr:hypothetical protein PoB_000712400 [Plakobranchus ocellatus]
MAFEYVDQVTSEKVPWNEVDHRAARTEGRKKQIQTSGSGSSGPLAGLTFAWCRADPGLFLPEAGLMLGKRLWPDAGLMPS